MKDHEANPFGYTLHERDEPEPVGRLVGYPASCGIKRSEQAILLRGRGSRGWLMTLASDGIATGWQLAASLRGPTNNEDADDLLNALRLDGLIERGARAHDTSQSAFLSLMPGHGKHYSYNREYWWKLKPGAGNAVLELANSRWAQ